jgi:hypothetical protein
MRTPWDRYLIQITRLPFVAADGLFGVSVCVLQLAGRNPMRIT